MSTASHTRAVTVVAGNYCVSSVLGFFFLKGGEENRKLTVELKDGS